MNGKRRPSLERESRIEAGHAIGVGGRNREAPAGVLERAAADPTDVILHRVQHRQQKVAARAGGASAVGKVVVGLNTSAPLPEGFRRSQEPIDSANLLGSRWPPGGPYVQLLGRDRNEPVDPDRACLELGSAGLGVGGVDGQDIGGDLVREMEGHEGEAGSQRRLKPNRRLD